MKFISNYRYTLTFYIFLVVAQLFCAFYFPIRFDDGHFATVAKSLAYGSGYGFSLYEKTFLFHPAITTGPLIIFPAALMVNFFGNTYWVLNITSVLIINILLVLCFYLLKRGFSKKHDIDILSTIFLILALYFSLSYYNLEHFNSFPLWYLLMGEIPAALLCVCAIIILSQEEIKYRFSISGFLFGLALMCKLISGLALAVGLLFLIFQKRFKQCLFVLFFASIPLFLFEIYKIILLGGAKEYIENNLFFYEQFILKATVTGKHNFLAIIQKITESIFATGYHYGLVSITLIFYLIFKISKLIKTINDKSFYNCAILCKYTFFVYLFWFVFFAVNLLRYLIIPSFFIALLLAIVLSNLKISKKFKEEITILIIFMIIEKICYFSVIYQYHLNYNSKSISYKKSIKEVVGILEKYEKSGYEIYSCGISFTTEFLLKKSNNFRRCEDYNERKSLNKTIYFDEYFYNNTVIDTNGVTISVSLPENLFVAKCNGRFLFYDDFFVIKKCSD
jgi:hypothetical protein